MGRGGKVGSRSNFNRKARFNDNGSDGSDEDYVVSDEGNEASDDDSKDYCSSLDEHASEESFGSFIEGEEEQEERVARKVIRSTVKKGSSTKKKIGEKTSRKRKNASFGEDEDEDFVQDEEDEDDDDEFTPDKDDSLYEEEELTTKRKRENPKTGRRGVYKRASSQGRKKRRKSATQKMHSRKGGRRKRGLKRKKSMADDDDDDDVGLIDDCTNTRRKSKLETRRKRRMYRVPSDSDFVSSGASDSDYTISEEEREQAIEANELCVSLKSKLRSSSISKIPEGEDLVQYKRPPRRKGKEKVEEVKVKAEVVKQVCGICLSEEDKRRLRGTLDCCTHYFCFTCIMEWSKVESRCPLCKQRFNTITKPARLAGGVDLRDVVIQVPRRDQVYQPSEEELRSYIDPYENVTCSECHQGGDDALMLLCDLCDSPAHTYCVGLGREVPEGNWYCDGCRPVALGSSSSQTQEFLSDQRTLNNNLYGRPSPIVNVGESLDSGILPSPHTPLTQAFSGFSSPRFPAGVGPAASPVSVARAPTLSGRRLMHRHIQSLLSSSRLNHIAGRTDAIPASHSSNALLNSSVARARETSVQQSRTPETGPSFNAALEERLQEDSSSVQSRDFFSSWLGQLSRHAVQSPIATSMDSNVNLTLWPELAEMSSVLGNDQISQWSTRSNIGSDGFGSPPTARDESILVAKEQLQSIVKNHVKNLSRDIQLGHSNLKDIAMSSMHTVLAACGFEHRRSEVHIVPPPLVCSHLESVAAGQTSLMKGCCPTCFDSFVKDVVKRIMDTTLPQWLSLGI